MPILQKTGSIYLPYLFRLLFFSVHDLIVKVSGKIKVALYMCHNSEYR